MPLSSLCLPRLLFAAGLGFACIAAAGAAEVFQSNWDNRGALPAGKEADAIIGDWVIRNETVVAVIGGPIPRRDANQMVEGVQGAVLDFAFRSAPNDLLVVLYPMGYRPTGMSATRAEVLATGGRTASVQFVREPTAEESWRTVTIYTLNDGEDALRVKTIHENPSEAAVTVNTSDWLRLDNEISSRQPRGDQPVILLENKWFGGAYGLASLDGRTQRAVMDLDQKDLRERGVLVHYPSVNPDQLVAVPLAPRQRIEYERALLLGRDAASVQIAANRLLGRAPGAVRLRVVEADGGAPVAGAFVDVMDGAESVSAAISDANGGFDLMLPDGESTLTVSQIGRPPLRQQIVLAGGRVQGGETLALAARSMVRLDIAEAGTERRMPVKVEFRARTPADPAPGLGPTSRANGSGNIFYSRRGDDTFPVPAGGYVALVSRGSEYGVVCQDVDVPPGGQAVIRARLRREIESPHWLMADLHNHSTLSGDSGAEVTGRVLNLAATGIEFAPATEHNRIADYTPAIRELGLEAFIASTAGLELSGRPGPNAINHQNAFPLTIHPDQPGFGASPTDANPGVQMRRLYDLDDRSPKLMQQNHPNIGWLYFDRDQDGEIDGGFGTRAITDVMEIREAMLTLLTATDREKPTRSGRAFHWLQMLNQGDRIFGTANTDAHSLSHENGAIFNYIHVGPYAVEKLDPWRIAERVRGGHVVMSNGPFLEVQIGDARPGDELAAPDGRIALNVKVEQASWSTIDRVQVLVNGRQLANADFRRATHPQLFAGAPRQFAHDISLELEQDAHLIVVAMGEDADLSARVGGRFAENHPMAVSNPIFVDVNGGGFKASGDTLDAPLPTAKRREGPAPK